MSWVMITTWGRLLDRDVHVSIWPDEIRVSGVRLNPDEAVAVLIDRANNQAHLAVPFDVAQSLALQHQYELIVPTKPGETFVGRIERLLKLRHPL
jgi:hypothetical protein